MLTRVSLVVLAACGGKAPPPEPVDNAGGASAPAAPCYPDRQTVTARELYEAATAGPPGTCTIGEATEERGGGEGEWEVREILDGDTRVATIDACGLEVLVPRITDDRGIAVGDASDAVILAYPSAELEYEAAAGLGGETQVSIMMGGLVVASMVLDGMGPASGADGDDAVAAITGQRVASYRTSFTCD